MRRAGASRSARRRFLLLAWALAALLPVPPAAAHEGCSRISIETREGRGAWTAYVVQEHDYVAKMHQLIDLNGVDGVWIVAAGELAQAGYAVIYTCLP